eukprot:364784-Ditylum_brightwellii.AAC.1
MGRLFRMIEEQGHFANMTGFAYDLVKNNGPIGSLLSTNQTREAGVLLSDVLRRHGGDQHLVAPVENSEEMVDLDLKAKDGLLAIHCSYPLNRDLQELLWVWLTDNKVPWNPSILEEENLTVPSCWDGES